ncbi:MAG TPA: hypothetical protein VFP84_19795 [Kofleriaceae bacterium]|nr:hypothetical protein [Kofleriaceae bacterium]
MKRAALSVLAAAACSRGAPITSCDDDLRGVYTAAPVGGDAAGAPWMILDDGEALAAYPLFPDPPALVGAATETAPRVIALARKAGAIAGEVHRRFMQRAAACDGRAPAHVVRCAGDTLELVLGDPVPPTGFAPCAWGAAAPSHAERWRRR